MSPYFLLPSVSRYFLPGEYVNYVRRIEEQRSLCMRELNAVTSNRNSAG